jgi:2,4-diketo-3-deoxy-L-fuconate hydrolase
MKLCRFDDNRLGVVEGNDVLDVSAALEVIPPAKWPLPHGDLLIANLDKVLPAVEKAMKSAQRKPLAEVALLSPIANPNKIVAAPVNYQKHLDEANANKSDFGQTQEIKGIDHYGPFLKSTSSLVGASEGVSLRFTDRRNDHEVELAVIIGKTADRISEDEVMSHIAGYAIGLDMTLRGTEDRSVRKSIDSYSVLGPWMVTADEIEDPNHLDFWITVNNELRQKSNTEYLVYNVQKFISWSSSFYTLYPGDVIMTGTPEGVGPVKDGDVMRCEIEQIGEMEVAVRAA